MRLTYAETAVGSRLQINTKKKKTYTLRKSLCLNNILPLSLSLLD